MELDSIHQFDTNSECLVLKINTNLFLSKEEGGTEMEISLYFEANNPVPKAWAFECLLLLSDKAAHPTNTVVLMLQVWVSMSFPVPLLAAGQSAVRTFALFLVVCSRIKFVSVQKIKIEIVVLIQYQKPDDFRGPKILLLVLQEAVWGMIQNFENFILTILLIWT